MKNIHLISTEKESNLYKNLLTDKLFALKNNYLMNVSEANRDNQFIYITDEEKISLNSSVYDKHRNVVLKAVDKGNVDFFNLTPSRYKKIVLTNDKDLIEDGVQAVEESFLISFAENPVYYFEVTKMLQTRWGTDWHNLPNQEVGREPEGIYRTIYTLKIAEKELERGITITKVSQLNEDGTQTDITDKPELWYINEPLKEDSLEEIVAYFQKVKPNNWEQEESIRQLFIDETKNKLWKKHGKDIYSFTEEYVNWLEEKLIEYVKKTL